MASTLHRLAEVRPLQIFKTSAYTHTHFLSLCPFLSCCSTSRIRIWFGSKRAHYRKLNGMRTKHRVDRFGLIFCVKISYPSKMKKKRKCIHATLAQIEKNSTRNNNVDKLSTSSHMHTRAHILAVRITFSCSQHN